jgi:hypothetical protein
MRSNPFGLRLTLLCGFSLILGLLPACSVEARAGSLPQRQGRVDTVHVSDGKSTPKTFHDYYRSSMKEKKDYIEYQSGDSRAARRDELEEAEKQEKSWDMLHNMVINPVENSPQGASPLPVPSGGASPRPAPPDLHSPPQTDRTTR